MHLATCSFLFIILGGTETSKPRSVNLALETVLEFGNNENSGDIQIIDKVQKFLDKVKTVIDKNKAARRNLVHKNNNKLTDFIKKAIHVLNDYENDDLEDVFAVIDNELRKYHYKGCKFYELVENYSVRRFMADQLETLKNLSAKSIRRGLKYISNEIDNESNGNMKDLLEYVNSFYTTKDAKEKLLNFLNNLDSYKTKSKRANLDLVNIVRDGIRSVIFDHYSGLDVTARRGIKIRLETFWKSSMNPKKKHHNIWNLQFTKSNKDKQTTNQYNYHEVRSIIDTSKIPKGFKTKTEVLDENQHKAKPEFYKAYKTDNSKSKYMHVKHDRTEEKKHKYTPKVLSSFITLYPEKITYEMKNNRFKITTTTERYNLQTLRYEKSKKKKSHLSLRERKPVKTLISDHGAAIDLQSKNKIDQANEELTKKHKSKTKKVKKHRHEYKPPRRHKQKHKTVKTTRSSQRTRKFRKSLKPTQTATSNEGMTIESFENEPSLRKYNYNDTMIMPKDLGNIYENVYKQLTKWAEHLKTPGNFTVEATKATKAILDNATKAGLTTRFSMSKTIGNKTKSLEVATTEPNNALNTENISKPTISPDKAASALKKIYEIFYHSIDLNPMLNILNFTKSISNGTHVPKVNYSSILNDIHSKNGLNINPYKGVHLRAPVSNELNYTFTRDVLDKDLKIFQKYNLTSKKTTVSDVNKFVNNSSVLQFQDGDKKKLLHGKMRADLNTVEQHTTARISTFAATQTTSALNYTKDPFKALVDSIDASINRIERLIK